jgi:hypothetical protein
MTTKPTAADRIKAKAERIKAHDRDAPAGTAAPDHPARPLPAAPEVQTKPVRSTVDLSPARHAALKRWSGEIAVEIGRSRVTTQDVLRALVVRLLTDEVLARKIQDDLRQDKY